MLAQHLQQIIKVPWGIPPHTHASLHAGGAIIAASSDSAPVNPPIILSILDVYKIWRPSPLFRAHRLEKALGTPARIYYKYEGLSPAGDFPLRQADQ